MPSPRRWTISGAAGRFAGRIQFGCEPGQEMQIAFRRLGEEGPADTVQAVSDHRFQPGLAGDGRDDLRQAAVDPETGARRADIVLEVDRGSGDRQRPPRPASRDPIDGINPIGASGLPAEPSDTSSRASISGKAMRLSRLSSSISTRSALVPSSPVTSRLIGRSAMTDVWYSPSTTIRNAGFMSAPKAGSALPRPVRKSRAA